MKIKSNFGKEFFMMNIEEDKVKQMSLWKRIVDLYVDGFRNMTIGRTLWILILIKLFVIFFILKLFFFPDLLKSNYNNDEDRAQHVRNELLRDR